MQNEGVKERIDGAAKKIILRIELQRNGFIVR
jgi:hypothetical protein